MATSDKIDISGIIPVDSISAQSSDTQADFTFLQTQTGLTWGNLSSHINKLEKADYVAVEKDFVGKKPHTMLYLTDKGRVAFSDYRKNIHKALNTLPPK